MLKSFVAGLRPRARAAPTPVSVDALESRRLMAVVAVDAVRPGRTISPQLSGTNLAYWQYELNTSKMQQMVRDAGLKLFRVPGGAAADEFHFFDPPPYNGYNTIPVMANNIQAAGGDAIVTIDYGSGSPQEAAAMLAYLNGAVGSAVTIGLGPTWDDTANAWVQKDFKTVGYWAGLRSAAKLGTDDGLNFLRVSHAAPWGFHYYEIGNEQYATWETDHHSSTGRGGTSPASHVTFAKTFNTYVQQIDPTVKIGLDVALPLRWNMPNANWTSDILAQSATQGFVPGFLSDHLYVTGLSDQDLLLHSINDPAYKQDNQSSSWAARASYYRNLLTARLGASGAGVQLMLTEFNSDIYTKQASNLVGGLWTADALAGLAQTEYTAAVQWDLTNGYNALATPDTTRYGWRQGVDMGMIGTGSTNGKAGGAYVPYPIYFAQQLFAKIDQTGSTMLPVTNNDPNLSVYAVKQTDGHVRLLVINKSATSAISGAVSFSGFSPALTATQWQYGIAEDTAQSLTTDGRSSLTTTTLTTGITTSGLTRTFPAYSMSVIDLTPATPPAWLSVAPGATYTLSGTTLTVNSGAVTFLADAGTSIPGLAVTVNAGASATINTTQHLGALVLAGTATVAGGGKVVRVTSLAETGAGTLDLNGNDLIIDYAAASPVASVRNWIITGRAGGAWTGAGLRSSTAAANPSNTLGYMEASQFKTIHGAAATFHGESIDSTAVLVESGFAGDLTFDGAVNFNDFLVLQNGFGGSGGYAGGDIDYSGGVDFNDFLALQNNFGATTPITKPTPATATPATTPPTTTPPAAAGTASLRGVAFNDHNRNGRFDRGDGVARGALVFLDADDDGLLDPGERSTTTDGQGRFAFVGLAAGTYRVRRAPTTGQPYGTPLPPVTLTRCQAQRGVTIATTTA